MSRILDKVEAVFVFWFQAGLDDEPAIRFNSGALRSQIGIEGEVGMDHAALVRRHGFKGD